jgi:heavy metal sensor kinase
VKRLGLRNVRSRLTLWYLALLAAELILYICGASVMQYWQLTAQLYHAEVQDIETVEGLLYFSPDGQLRMQENYHNNPASMLLLDRLMEVLASDGTILYRNDLLGIRDLGGPPFLSEGQKNYDRRTLRLADGTRVLLISHIHSINGRPLLIRLAYSLSPLQQRMTELIVLLLFAMPLALLTAGFMAFKITRQTLAPLEEIARRTEQITATRLHDRLPIQNPEDEFGQIAKGFNALLARLEDSFDQLRRFTSDASHELRTPLAAIRGVGEIGLQKEHNTEEYRDIIGSMLEEVTRLTRMVESLLTISRADAREIELQMSVFSMTDLVQEAIALVDVLAEEREQAFSMTADQSVLVRADRLLLRQAIVNVLHNAVKYSPARTIVSVSIRNVVDSPTGESWVTVDIVDHGPGIRGDDRFKVFNRFYRVDEGRSREIGGAGLGLAIAKWAVQLQGGEIGVENVPGGGSDFFIRMPHFQDAST